MGDIVHPQSDEPGGLVQNDPNEPSGDGIEKDTSWRWMVAIAVVVGVFAWLTR